MTIEIKNTDGRLIRTFDVDSLAGFDLSEIDLSDADLRGITLDGVSLRRTKLCRALLNRCRLIDADFTKADLSHADLDRADITGANLTGARCFGTRFGGAIATGANFEGVDLSQTAIQQTHLWQADLSKAVGVELALARESIVPSHGAFTGWKLLRGDLVVQLQIPAEARRASFGRECRAEAAKVIEIEGGRLVGMSFDTQTEYRVGETVRAHEWGDHPMGANRAGIHFFVTRLEAEHHRDSL
jgi:hypothetical protein